MVLSVRCMSIAEFGRSVRGSALAFAACSVLCVQGLMGGPLDRETQRLIERTDLGGGKASVYVVDLDSGEELASYRADTAMIPASNMKLLTTGAALYVLGDSFTFRTQLILDETLDPPLLIIRGDGDPALGDPAIFIGEKPGVTLATLFDQIAAALQRADVTAISGVVVDDRVFDRDYTHPDWPEDQLNRWYCAQVGGLNFHTNVLNVYTEPSSGGTPIVRFEPDAYWAQITVRAKSNSRSRDTAWVSRPQRNNSFTVHGNVSSKSEIPVAIDTPPMFAGRLLAHELSQRGIAVGGGGTDAIDTVSLIEPSMELVDSKTIAIITTPIADVLERTNTDSHNLYAEALLKRIGHEITSDPGSWKNGGAVLRMMLAEHLGPEVAENTVISDGSGMSRMNRVSAKTFVQWMRALSRSDHWDAYAASMANPGDGTLRRRFDGGELRAELSAKSGYLTGTYALSGVLEHPRTHQRIGFSILLNDVRAGATSRNAKPLIDDIVEEIDDLMSERAGEPAMGG